MTTDIITFDDKRFILLKSGLSFKISQETASKIEKLLGEGEGHRFIKISESDVMINSAEVEGVYTAAQYDELVNIKQGMYQCTFRIWHKRRDECSCRLEVQRKVDFVRRLQQRLVNETDLDDFSKTNLEGYIRDETKWLQKRGIFITS